MPAWSELSVAAASFADAVAESLCLGGIELRGTCISPRMQAADSREFEFGFVLQCLRPLQARNRFVDQFGAWAADEFRRRAASCALADRLVEQRIETLRFLCEDDGIHRDAITFFDAPFSDGLGIRCGQFDSVTLECTDDGNVRIIRTASSAVSTNGKVGWPAMRQAEADASAAAEPDASTMSNAWVIATPPRSSISVAEQYLVADNSTARATCLV